MTGCIIEIIWEYKKDDCRQKYISVIPYGCFNGSIEQCVDTYGCECSSNATTVDFYFHTLKNILYLYFLKCYEKQLMST